jgi:acetyl esterase/lipase|tara:strand:+ start:6181 stop:7170 length:990 start_codon:yes stop_codon:yes gene_type:complete
MSIENRAFSNKPDYSVNSTTPVETAEELISFDKKMGGFSINRKTYKIFRFMNKFLAGFLAGLIVPKPDKSKVTIENRKDIERGVLIVHPEEKKTNGALFIVHGGGYVVGNYMDNLGYACDTARELGITVISPGHGLGPEEPFPAGINDLHATWHWLQKEAASMDIDPSKIVVGGISAGGGIAAGLVQKLHDEGGIQPAAQLLIYPMLDDRVAANRELDERSHRVWNNGDSNLFGWSSYLGQDPGGEVQPYSVPGRRENLKDLPATWIGIGTADLFLDEDREYAKRLKDSGVDVSYVEVAGGIHAFDGAQTQMGIDFVQLQREFVNKHVK